MITKPLTPRMQLRNVRAYSILKYHPTRLPVAEGVERAGLLVGRFNDYIECG